MYFTLCYSSGVVSAGIFRGIKTKQIQNQQAKMARNSTPVLKARFIHTQIKSHSVVDQPARTENRESSGWESSLDRMDLQIYCNLSLSLLHHGQDLS